MIEDLKKNGYESFIVYAEGQKGEITKRKLLKLVKQKKGSYLDDESIIDWALDKNKKDNNPWQGDGGALKIFVNIKKGTIEIYKYLYVINIELEYKNHNTVEI